MYAFDLFLRRVCIVLWCVFYVCGNIYRCRLHVWQMHYGVRVLHLQHRVQSFQYDVYARNFKCIFLAFAHLWPLYAWLFPPSSRQGTFAFPATNYPRCRPQSSPAWMPWNKLTYIGLLTLTWMIFRQNTSGLCLRIYAFDFFVQHVCGSHWTVCFVILWEYIYISFACLANALWGTSTSFTA